MSPEEGSPPAPTGGSANALQTKLALLRYRVRTGSARLASELKDKVKDVLDKLDSRRDEQSFSEQRDEQSSSESDQEGRNTSSVVHIQDPEPLVTLRERAWGRSREGVLALALHIGSWVRDPQLSQQRPTAAGCMRSLTGRCAHPFQCLQRLARRFGRQCRGSCAQSSG